MNKSQADRYKGYPEDPSNKISGMQNIAQEVSRRPIFIGNVIGLKGATLADAAPYMQSVDNNHDSLSEDNAQAQAADTTYPHAGGMYL